ncbi:hypothetical protein F4774DRAFT_370522 [Daldinia eschscholtzii]|nr:hypothetical protein F4774DRAFT_370522 [Daldinia eschscholtzii]
MSVSASKGHRGVSPFSRSDPEFRSLLEEPASKSSSKCDAKHGLFILVDKPPEQDEGIDIVAIHGLNGHYRKTWAAETPNPGRRYNWLQEALPQAIPSARIMSFGYDSAVFNKSAAEIDEFADQFLRGLLGKRCEPGEQARPLLFLCYSLGGIVFKKAIIRARERRYLYKGILSCVRGVAFFGTPNRGSAAARWAKALASVLNIVSFNSDMNSTLLQNLEKQSNVLSNISESFLDRCEGLKIVSFYETRQLSGTGIMILPKKSALLFKSNETPIPLNTDHRSLCRFSTTEEDSERLNLILSNLKDLANQIISQHKRGPSIEEEKALQDSNMAQTIESFMRFFDQNKSREWGNMGRSSIPLMWATPGAGKAAISRFLIDHLRNSANRAAGQESIFIFYLAEDNYT